MEKDGFAQGLTAEQITELEKAGQLQLLTSPEWVTVKDGTVMLNMALPRQGVSLLKLSWE